MSSVESPKALVAHVRRLAAHSDALLYIRFSISEIEQTGFNDGQRIRVSLDQRITVCGILKLTANNPWLAPDAAASNADISAQLTRAGFKLGEDVPALVDAG
jgi:hypothetical protein